MATTIRSLFIIAALAATSLVSPANAKDIPAELPKPDNKPPDTTKPVKVYFLSGQSNMCGMGRADSLKPLATSDAKFAYLIDDKGNWTVRNDVHYIYYVMDKREKDGQLTVFNRIGPEVGIGHVLGYYHDEVVLLIKGACGNRSLGWDFMPPTSRKRLGKASTDGGWYAGTSYDRYVKHAKSVLADLEGNLPGYKGQGYEMAGIFWWQGHKDKGMAQEMYEQLLAELIQDLRADFKAPDAPFVVATVGFSGRNLGPWKGVFDAQMAISDPKRHPKFAGNVASVDIRDMGGGGYHYGNNGATYTKVGDAMGRAMAKLLLKSEKKAADPKDVAALAEAEKMVAEKQYVQAVAALGKLASAKPDTDIAKKAAERLKALQDDPAVGQSVIDAEADAFEGRCVAAEEKKDYVLAIKLYEQYVGQFPKASRFAKVKAHLESLKSDKAIQAAIKSTQADGDCKGWMSLADNYANLGMNAKAREYLTRIVDKYGDTDWGAKARARLAQIPDR